MNCQQIENNIFDYCDNKLSPQSRAQIEEHILDCPKCEEKIALTKLENSVLHNLPFIEAPHDFTAEVMERVFVTPPHKDTHFHKIIKPLLFVVPVAAILLIFLTTGIPNMFIHDNPIPKQISENATTKFTPSELTRDKKDTNYKITPESAAPTKESTGRTIEEDRIIPETNIQPEINEIIIADLSLKPETEELVEITQESSRSLPKTIIPYMEKEKTILKINGLPDNYTLTEIDNISPTKTIYSYYDSIQQIYIDIVINQLSPETSVENHDFMQSTCSKMILKETNLEPEINHYSWELTDKDNQYLISLQANLPAEELAYLSSVISIEN